MHYKKSNKNLKTEQNLKKKSISKKIEERTKLFEELINNHLVNKERENASELSKIKNETKYILLILDEIIFDKNYISFKTEKASINPFFIEGIVPELNLIKDSFFNYKHKILLKFAVYQQRVLENESTGIQKIKNIIDLAKSQLNKDISKGSNISIEIPDFKHFTNSEIIKKYTKANDKKDYINLLVRYQDSSSKIIPIIENRNNIKEVSFIFTIKQKNNIYYIWESCIENRGTHIFKTNTKLYKHTLENLKSYIVDPTIKFKRKKLWWTNSNSTRIKQKLNYFESILHRGTTDFNLRLTELIRR